MVRKSSEAHDRQSIYARSQCRIGHHTARHDHRPHATPSGHPVASIGSTTDVSFLGRWVRRPRHAETGLLGEVLDRRRAFLCLHLVNSSDRFFVADEATEDNVQTYNEHFWGRPFAARFRTII